MIKKPPIMAIKEPVRLTIKGENLQILVMMIGNSSFKMLFCKTNPITILKISNSIKGHLRFQSPSCDLEKLNILD